MRNRKLLVKSTHAKLGASKLNSNPAFDEHDMVRVKDIIYHVFYKVIKGMLTWLSAEEILCQTYTGTLILFFIELVYVRLALLAIYYYLVGVSLTKQKRYL